MVFFIGKKGLAVYLNAFFSHIGVEVSFISSLPLPLDLIFCLAGVRFSIFFFMLQHDLLHLAESLHFSRIGERGESLVELIFIGF